MGKSGRVILVLTVIVLCYMLLGAAIFQLLEQNHENDHMKRHEHFMKRLANGNNISVALVRKIVVAHETEGSRDTETSTSKWDFEGSFFFVCTILTTIGFGLTSPQTVGGQLFFILYAILGIPLYTLLLNTALERTLPAIAWVYEKFLLALQSHKVFRRHRKHPLPIGGVVAIGLLFAVLLVVTMTGFFSVVESWTLIEGLYFTVVACTTVGFGDYVPNNIMASSSTIYKSLNWFLVFVGVFAFYIFLNLITSAYKHILQKIKLIPPRPRNKMLDGTGSVTATLPSEYTRPAPNDSGSLKSVLHNLKNMKLNAQGSLEVHALASIEDFLTSQCPVRVNKQGKSKDAWLLALRKLKEQAKNRQTSLLQDIRRSFSFSFPVNEKKFVSQSSTDFRRRVSVLDESVDICSDADRTVTLPVGKPVDETRVRRKPKLFRMGSIEEGLSVSDSHDQHENDPTKDHLLGAEDWNLAGTSDSSEDIQSKVRSSCPSSRVIVVKRQNENTTFTLSSESLKDSRHEERI